MAVSKSQQKAVHKYVKANYDRMELTVSKGRKDTIKAVAAAAGESVNAYINTAITQRMERDGGGAASETAGKGLESTQGARVVSLSSEALEAAQRAAEATGEDIPAFIARAVGIQAQRDKPSLRMGINPDTGGKLEKEE